MRSEIVGGMFFGQIFPVSDGHVLSLLSGVEAFAYADGLEVGLPELFVEFLVGREQGVVQSAGDEVRGLLVGSNVCGLSVGMIVAVLSPLVE